ncbi:hypothetical protein AC1031_000683 [Aphanomyces cochlioides]|nr:hypothetical protein AC1031_000683 [Aphanomyces cochlioides]
MEVGKTSAIQDIDDLFGDPDEDSSEITAEEKNGSIPASNSNLHDIELDLQDETHDVAAVDVRLQSSEKLELPLEQDQAAANLPDTLSSVLNVPCDNAVKTQIDTLDFLDTHDTDACAASIEFAQTESISMSFLDVPADHEQSATSHLDAQESLSTSFLDVDNSVTSQPHATESLSYLDINNTQEPKMDLKEDHQSEASLLEIALSVEATSSHDAVPTSASTNDWDDLLRETPSTQFSTNISGSNEIVSLEDTEDIHDEVASIEEAEQLPLDSHQSFDGISNEPVQENNMWNASHSETLLPEVIHAADSQEISLDEENDEVLSNGVSDHIGHNELSVVNTAIEHIELTNSSENERSQPSNDEPLPSTSTIDSGSSISHFPTKDNLVEIDIDTEEESQMVIESAQSTDTFHSTSGTLTSNADSLDPTFLQPPQVLGTAPSDEVAHDDDAPSDQSTNGIMPETISELHDAKNAIFDVSSHSEEMVEETQVEQTPSYGDTRPIEELIAFSDASLTSVNEDVILSSNTTSPPSLDHTEEIEREDVDGFIQVDNDPSNSNEAAAAELRDSNESSYCDVEIPQEVASTFISNEPTSDSSFALSTDTGDGEKSIEVVEIAEANPSEDFSAVANDPNEQNGKEDFAGVRNIYSEVSGPLESLDPPHAVESSFLEVTKPSIRVDEEIAHGSFTTLELTHDATELQPSSEESPSEASTSFSHGHDLNETKTSTDDNVDAVNQPTDTFVVDSSEEPFSSPDASSLDDFSQASPPSDGPSDLPGPETALLNLSDVQTPPSPTTSLPEGASNPWLSVPPAAKPFTPTQNVSSNNPWDMFHSAPANSYNPFESMAEEELRAASEDPWFKFQSAPVNYDKSLVDVNNPWTAAAKKDVSAEDDFGGFGVVDFKQESTTTSQIIKDVAVTATNSWLETATTKVANSPGPWNTSIEFDDFGNVSRESFGDFHQASDDFHQVSDDFGDFGGAQESLGGARESFGDFTSAVVPPNPTSDNDGRDSFGDFSSATVPPTSASNDDGRESFGDFSSAAAPVNSSSNDDGDEFGDFSSGANDFAQRGFSDAKSAPQFDGGDDFGDFESSAPTQESFGDFSSVAPPVASFGVPFDETKITSLFSQAFPTKETIAPNAEDAVDSSSTRQKILSSLDADTSQRSTVCTELLVPLVEDIHANSVKVESTKAEEQDFVFSQCKFALTQKLQEAVVHHSLFTDKSPAYTEYQTTLNSSDMAAILASLKKLQLEIFDDMSTKATLSIAEQAALSAQASIASHAQSKEQSKVPGIKFQFAWGKEKEDDKPASIRVLTPTGASISKLNRNSFSNLHTTSGSTGSEGEHTSGSDGDGEAWENTSANSDGGIEDRNHPPPPPRTRSGSLAGAVTSTGLMKKFTSKLGLSSLRSTLSISSTKHKVVSLNVRRKGDAATRTFDVPMDSISGGFDELKWKCAVFLYDADEVAAVAPSQIQVIGSNGVELSSKSDKSALQKLLKDKTAVWTIDIGDTRDSTGET